MGSFIIMKKCKLLVFSICKTKWKYLKSIKSSNTLSLNAPFASTLTRSFPIFRVHKRTILHLPPTRKRSGLRTFSLQITHDQVI